MKHIQIKSLVLFFVFLFWGNFFAFGQIKSFGIPAIKNYTKNQYKAATQNWDIIQDEYGTIYFANNLGILSYDGVEWKLSEMKKYLVGRGLTIDKYNRIYVGAFNEFGYMEKNAKGNLTYISLSDSLPVDERNFSDIWKGHNTPQGIYFQSNSIFFYDYEKVHFIAKNPNFVFSFYVNNRFFVQDKKVGLLELRGNKLYYLLGTKEFTGDKDIWGMLPYGDSILIATQRYGLFIYDGYTTKKFDCPVNQFLIENQIFSIIALPGNNFSVGTIQNGLYIFNSKGEVIQHLNKKRGLLNNTVLSQYLDSNGQLWLGFDNGISYVEINSPFSFLDDGMGIEGTGYTSILHDNMLYLGTNQGVFCRNWNTDENNSSFRLIENTTGQVWKLGVYDNQLLVGHNIGTLLIDNMNVSRISEVQGGWTYLKHSQQNNVLIGGNYFCMQKFDKNAKGNWQFNKVIGNFPESCRVIAEDIDGSLWISHGLKGFYNIKLNAALDSVIDLKFYNKNDGLPSNFDNNAYFFDNRMIFCTENSIFSFNREKKRFELDTALNTFFAHFKTVRIPQKDADGNVWFSDGERPYMLKKQANGSYTLIDSVFRPLSKELVGGFEHINLIDRNNVIFGVEEGFVHYDPQFQNTNKTTFRSIIKHLIFTDKNDTIPVFGRSQKSLKIEINHHIDIPFKRNSIRIIFTAPYFQENEDITYSYKLKNYDKNWSQWQSNSQKEYSNLPSGKYIFSVRAKNIYGEISEKANIELHIQTPWYRTILAYMVYALLFGAIVLIIIRIIFKKFERERQKLKEKQTIELLRKEEEHSQKEVVAQQKIIQLKNEKLEIEIAKNKADVELKNKELASIALQITHKNEILDELKHELENVSRKVNQQAKMELNVLINRIDQDLQLDDDWERFVKHFEEVHAGFFKRLREHFPQLTPKDLKMCAYLRMNLSTKEITQLLNISIRGVEMSRYRLRKKLNLDKDANLIEYMMNV